MAATRSTPSLTRRRLGALLRSYREGGEKKILSKTAAKHIGVESTVFGRMERGEHRIHPKQIEKLLELYGVDDPEIHAELRRACMEPFDAGWWYPYRNEIKSDLLDYVALEGSATEILSVVPIGVDGLLQSPNYVRHIQAHALVEAAQEREDLLVAFRMARQQVITRTANPVRHRSLTSEVTFQENSPVMAEQIRYMLGLSFRENIEIRIMEMTSPYTRQMYTHSQIMSFRNPWPSVLATVGMDTTQLTDNAEELERANQYFDGLVSHSLSIEDSRSLLTERLETIESITGNQVPK